jgi:pilus retraction protein PilT
MTTSEQGQALLLRMLTSMEKWQASDLYISENQRPAARINGSVVQLELPETTTGEMRDFLHDLLSENAREYFDRFGDKDIGYSLPNGKRFRINLYKQKGFYSLVARALPSGELTFEELGLPPVVKDLAEIQRGLVLVTGATGSGKSTTLAAMVHHINATKKLHIITIEDPIEFVHNNLRSRITQREVGSDTESFHSALRHVVRQSPDVILIGEMRDMETMQVAISAALTGHVVFATLHTIDTAQTLQRILSYFPEHLRAQAAMDLSLSLQGVISQRLLPNAKGDGRTLAVEVLTTQGGAVRLIREQRSEELIDFMRSANHPSIISFNRSLLQLYKKGAISFEIGKAYASNPDEFALSTQGMETGTLAFRGSNEEGRTEWLDMKALLYMVLERGASDLHITIDRPPILRISGKLFPLPMAPLSAKDLRLLLFSILNTRQRTIYELEREIDFALALEDGRRFRINAYYQKGNMAASLRAIPSKVPSADKLYLPPIVLELGKRPHGLLLVVGPTGSGKTTTLACLVSRINQSRACRIITVEDPIEYTHQSELATVDQREVYSDTKSFSAALKYVLRQDPDVIMVGEMRDMETVSAALTAAETGHLVLATLHTNDAIQAIDRIIDVFPPHQQSQVRSQLAASLLGVISQRLLPALGKSHRVPVFEIMLGNDAVRTLIRDNKMHQAITYMETHLADGMITMDMSLKRAFEQGLIEYSEAIRYARNPKSIPRPGNSPTKSFSPSGQS